MVGLSLTAPTVWANTENPQDLETPSTTLKVSTFVYDNDGFGEYVGTHAPTLLKSDDSLFDTAKSVSVITQKQMYQKQATTLADALNGVAGVTAGQYGRRGWDDFTIRGQLANSQIMVDGMRTSTSTNFLHSMEVSGLEAVEVVKGPDSVGFGQMMPGGVVNLTTKKPKADNFQTVTVSVGSENFYQGAFDLNFAPNDSTDGAFRINGRVSDQDDFTDEVYFKNKYLAPSYRFMVGDKTDVTLLGSYLQRDYIRQQGLPLQNDTYQKYPRTLFFGEPQHKIDDKTLRLGYQLSHDFDNGWQLNQNFAMTKRDADAEAVIANSTSPMNGTRMRRQLNQQIKHDKILSLDNRIDKTFDMGRISHNVMVGLDMFRERSDYQSNLFAYTPMDLANPVYGAGTYDPTRPLNNSRHILSKTQYAGLYAKDTMKIDDKWIASLAGRYDWTKVKSENLRTNVNNTNKDNAFTGTTSLMYQHNDMVAPYISYGTSFLPTDDIGKDGELLDPETGSQFEVGVKFQSPNQRMQGAISYYDLTRKNVSESFNDGTTNYNVAVGKQKTKGLEAEFKAQLNDNWNLTSTYSYIPTAEVLEAGNRSNYVVGQRLNHVPKHVIGLTSQYYFDPTHQGWYVGGGVRYEGEHPAERGTSKINLPSYVLADAEAGFESKHWRLGFAVKNVFDKDYYSGTSPNASMVMFGEPRSYRFNATYKF